MGLGGQGIETQPMQRFVVVVGLALAGFSDASLPNTHHSWYEVKQTLASFTELFYILKCDLPRTEFWPLLHSLTVVLTCPLCPAAH